MRCLVLLVLGSFLGPSAAWGQYAGVASHSVYLELGGFGGAYSVNYDRLLPTGAVFRVGATNGTICGMVGSCRRTIAAPVGMSYLFGNPLGIASSNQWVEVGGGVVVGMKGEAPNSGVGVGVSPFVSLGALVGLRRQPAGRGVTFRLAVTPLLTLGEAGGTPPGGVMLSAGIALGYAF